jgi:hypothetical protein
VRAAQKLLDVPTIGGGIAQAGDGGRGSQRSQIHPHAAQKVQKWRKTGGFAHYLAENVVFRSKVLNKIYSQNVF